MNPSAATISVLYKAFSFGPKYSPNGIKMMLRYCDILRVRSAGSDGAFYLGLGIFAQRYNVIHRMATRLSDPFEDRVLLQHVLQVGF
jgi:hypothetical protein